MELNVYAIYDSKVKGYMQPFMARQDGEAIRRLMSTLDNKDTELSKYPQDFSLFRLATYDELTGDYKPLVEKPCIARVWEMIKPEDNKQLVLPLKKEGA